MGALAGNLASGGGASVSANSSASAGPLTGTTGSLVLNFGGINLGNQDIPLNAETTSQANQPPLVGNAPSRNLLGSVSSGINPLYLIAGLGLILWYFARKKK